MIGIPLRCLTVPQYDRIRLNIQSSSSTNGCKFEIYQNLVSDYFGMFYMGSGNGGEVVLPAGTYYLRIVSTNTFSDFNAEDIPVYTLSVAPVSKVDMVSIAYFDLPLNKIEYNEGLYDRLEENDMVPNILVVHGRATYKGRGAANVIISGEVFDRQWIDGNQPELARVYGTAITDSNGNFTMKIQLNPACGGLSYNIGYSTHHYDFMRVTVYLANNKSITDRNYFYYYKYST